MTYFLAFSFSLILYHKIHTRLYSFTRFELYSYEENIYEEITYKPSFCEAH